MTDHPSLSRTPANALQMPYAKPEPYTYNATVVSVYDGDTITVDIDLGFGVSRLDVKIRLFGINAPELKGETKEAGEAAAVFLRSLVEGKRITLRTYKDKMEKFGRFLGDVWVEKPDGSIAMANKALIEFGHAVSYMGVL